MAVLLGLITMGSVTAKAEPKKVVLIAGPITGPPKHTHEYEKSVILLKHLLDTSPNTQGQLVVEAHFKGWPMDEKTLNDAATIVMISDGSDRNATDHPLYVGERFQTLERQMQRGCGFVQFHWATFNPSRVHEQITERIAATSTTRRERRPTSGFRRSVPGKRTCRSATPSIRSLAV
jgi:hypothetical protein